MKRILLIILGLALAYGVYAFFFKDKGEIHVLVFSKTEGFRHASIADGKKALIDMGKQKGFTVDTTEDASIFTEEELQRYNVIVFLSTTGDILDNAQQLEMNRWVQAGGGFVGIHAAADTEYDWDWYNKLVGAYFESHPNDPNVREAEIEVLDSENLTVKHLAKRWRRSDEWYNYKSIQPHINVVLNLDESTYEGGTNGERHPISWYHEFDGGRSFYTGLGHTPETFSEPQFLEHLWGGIQYVGGEGKPVNYDVATVAPEENRFSKVILAERLYEPMELEILPNRDILFIERRGTLKVFDPENDSLMTVAEFPVHTVHEDGLLGLALDPNYSDNHWIYLFYSPEGEEAKQHVSRFVYQDRNLDKDSEKVLLEIPTQREECCHSAGSLEFGPNGNLFISTGDNTNPHESDGYSPSDEREGRSPFDAQKSSANTQDLRGKVLRIKPQDDGTYSIPEGNLFSKDGKEGRPEIYVMGCRNPYRISIDKATGYLYWGDVGPDAGEDSTQRGPAGHDEVNQAKKAGFFGWPYFIGDNKPYFEYDFAAQKTLGEHNPQKPINNSPNNTGAQELPPAQKAFIWYPYGESKEFPNVGNGGRNAMAGPIYHFENFPESDKQYPKYYDGKLFTYDWIRGWLMAVTLDENGDFVRMQRFLPSIKFNNPIDIVMGPDGDMFMLEYGTNWFQQNDDARLVHLQYTAGNREPLAKFVVDKQYGSLPMEVSFSGKSSVDFDGDALTYAWDFGDGQTATGDSVSHIFDKAGAYTAKLTVTDSEGLQHSTQMKVYAGNAKPQITWEISGNKSFFWENSELAYEVKVSDEEDGSLGAGIDPSSVAISIDYLSRGKDRNLVEIGHAANVEAARVSLGKQLIEESDCKACHQLDMQSVGPTYQAIAEKYASDAKAIPYLANKILKGGGGVWGDIAMAAHPQLVEDEAQQMVKYILSLAGSPKANKGLPMKGSYAFDQHKAEEFSGSYILTATYTDKGGKEIGPLSNTLQFQLGHPRMEAYKYFYNDKAMKMTVGPDMTDLIEEEITLMIGTAGSVVGYKGIDLSGIGSIDFAVAAMSLYFGGGTMEMHIDAPDGPLIGQLEVETSLSLSMEGDPSRMELEPTEGIHDLYLVFKAAEGSNKPVASVVWLEFKQAEGS